MRVRSAANQQSSLSANLGSTGMHAADGTVWLLTEEDFYVISPGAVVAAE